ncbi:uncharacterized protein At2g02148 isoform X2 [Solanum tuberosum]|uniref:Cgi-62 n=1 Tax=Solanum tuberosum TaxID=4113 RepID=M1D3P2_SOLTU|nr:PREDICTED: uncharacterized protein At2g02148 isoform X2 [Solanum tuberosum]
MGTRVPVQHYDMRSAADSYIETSLHDLNAEGIGGGGAGGDDVDRGGGDVTEDSMDNGEESTAVDCLHETFRNSLPLHGIVVEEDRTSIENSGSSTGSYNIVTIDDISPIETARTRFLDIIVDHFIRPHVVDVVDSEADFAAQSSQDKMSKRKSREIHYEGDATYVLPLMYVANMYETLVNEVNVRLSSLNGMREKTIGVALEAAGGLYRKLAKKFPRKGPCIFKRRELATSFETRARFPELVIQEEKRVRFVVVNGLAIVEKPTSLCIDDAEWFRRMTGRNEVTISPRDYKFYAPRHKYRRASNSISNITGFSAFTSTDNASSLAAGQSYRSVSESADYLKAANATSGPSGSISSPSAESPPAPYQPKSTYSSFLSQSTVWPSVSLARNCSCSAVANQFSAHGLLTTIRPCRRTHAYNAYKSCKVLR